MCGRYTLTQVGPQLVGERFELGEAELEPATLGRFNVCPTEDILVVTHKGPRAVRWGLVPSYVEVDRPGAADDQRARRRRVASKKVFARLLERPERRCLVIADGWYEWLRAGEEGRAARAVPLPDRRRRAVRVRGAVRRREDRRRVGAVGDDPHHDRQRGLRARARPHAGRARRPRRGGGVDAGRRPRAARPDRGRAHVARRPPTRRSTRPASRARSCSSRPRPKLRAMPTRALLLSLLALLVLAAPASATIVPGKGMAGVELEHVPGAGDRDPRRAGPDVRLATTSSASCRATTTTSAGSSSSSARARALPGAELDPHHQAARSARSRASARARCARRCGPSCAGEKCRTFKQPKRIRICWLGSFTPSKPITEFRIDSKGRVNNVRVAYVID